MRTVKKPDVRRHEIIEAATELFLSQTYDKTTTGQVMEALGIAKGTIYHYFSSKEHLMEAVVDELAEGYVRRREAELANAGGDALARLALLFSPEQRSGSETSAMESLHKPGNVKLHTRLLAVLVLRLAPVVADLVAQGCKEGVFHTEHPLEAAELLLAGIQFLTDQGVYPWENEALLRRAGAIPSMVERVLGAEPGSITFL
ncbi:MAG: TetR/AcrR family transcriptional regulator [Gemmatimonadales bacterium]